MKKYINCPYCNQLLIQEALNRHLCAKHLDKYNEQINLIKSLFFDYNFSESTLDQYSQVILSYKTILNIWKQTYTDLERKLRMKKCNVLHQSKNDQFLNNFSNNNYNNTNTNKNEINNICSICGEIKEKQLISHIKNYHQDIYKRLIANIKNLFYDSNFVRQNYDRYKNKLCNISYSTIYNIWVSNFGKKIVSNRQKILKRLNINN